MTFPHIELPSRSKPFFWLGAFAATFLPLICPTDRGRLASKRCTALRNFGNASKEGRLQKGRYTAATSHDRTVPFRPQRRRQFRTSRGDSGSKQVSELEPTAHYPVQGVDVDIAANTRPHPVENGIWIP